MGNDAAALQLQWFEAQSVNSVGFLWHLVWTTLFHDTFNSTPECFDWECSPLMKACKTKFDWASYHTQDCMLSFLCWTRNTYWVNCLPVVFRLFSFFSRFETLRIIATQGKNATVIVPDRIDPESALRVTGNGSSGSWIFEFSAMTSRSIQKNIELKTLSQSLLNVGLADAFAMVPIYVCRWINACAFIKNLAAQSKFLYSSTPWTEVTRRIWMDICYR